MPVGEKGASSLITLSVDATKRKKEGRGKVWGFHRREKGERRRFLLTLRIRDGALAGEEKGGGKRV